MERAIINGVELEYEVRGVGEPVLLIHGSLLAESFRPLMDQASLSSYKLVRFHRRGYAGSKGDAAGIAQDADDAAALIDHLGLSLAHVVGHSYGGNVAIQLALHAPAGVRSLTVIEPGAEAHIPSAGALAAAATRIGELAAENGIEWMLDLYMRALGGSDYRDTLSSRLRSPVWELLLRDLEASFRGDEPSEFNWSFDAERAALITCPLLNVMWSGSDAAMAKIDAELETTSFGLFGEIHELVRAWFPQAQSVVVPGDHHFALVTDPDPVADVLARFFASARAPAEVR